MRRFNITFAALWSSAFALSGCSGQSDAKNGADGAKVGRAEVETATLTKRVDFSCEDRAGLYVDVLNDPDVLRVRERRLDPPTILRRTPGSSEFTGPDHSISGVAGEVVYSAPKRPSVKCLQRRS